MTSNRHLTAREAAATLGVSLATLYSYVSRGMLLTLAHALGLPAESPLILFSLGRTLGWIAHAIEQYADTRLIRPRARYVGPLPENLPEKSG